MSLLHLRQHNTFADPPDFRNAVLNWPTNNRTFYSNPESYFARTRVNPDYGRPGWTRDCGKRFHRGCDIAPKLSVSDGTTRRVLFSDCAAGKEYFSDEPAFLPDDDVYAVLAGFVAEINSSPDASTLGNYIILEHALPGSPRRIFSLYAHLESLHVDSSERVDSGQIIGCMGQTSSSLDARNWMAIAPHLHLEFWNDQGESFNPENILLQIPTG